MSSSDGWPLALVEEVRVFEETCITQLRGGAHDDAGHTMHDKPPDFLTESDLKAVDKARDTGSTACLAEHIDCLKNTVPTLFENRPQLCKVLRESRLPYLEEVCERMAKRSHPRPVDAANFGYNDDPDSFNPSAAIRKALPFGFPAKNGRASSGRSQHQAVSGQRSGLGCFGALAGKAMANAGLSSAAHNPPARNQGQSDKAEGKRRVQPQWHGLDNDKSTLFNSDGTVRRQIQQAAMKLNIQDGHPRPNGSISQRARKTIGHDDMSDQDQNQFRRHDTNGWGQARARPGSNGERERGQQQNLSHADKAVKQLNRTAIERHGSTYQDSQRTGSMQQPRTTRGFTTQKRGSPDMHDELGRDASDWKKRRQNGQAEDLRMTRRVKKQSTPKKGGQVIDLMESDEEAGESAGMATDVPQREDPLHDVEPSRGSRRTRSGGNRRALSPPSMTMDTDLEGLRYKYPPNLMVGAVEVTGHDLLTLRPFEFVNDTIMDYYSKRIAEKYRHWLEIRETIAKLHWFNSFFYKKLTEKCQGSMGDNVSMPMYQKVCKWTKNVDVFAQDFLLIPIHDAAHWSLAIICHPGSLRYSVMEAHKYARSTRGRGAEGKASTSRDPDELLDVPLPYILHLDPIAHGGHDTKAVGLALKQWLRMEWENDVSIRKQVKDKDGVACDCVAVRDSHEYQKKVGKKRLFNGDEVNKIVEQYRVKKIQHQDNYYDCGLYTLTYMEFFAFRTPMQIHPGTRFRGRAELELVWNDDFPKNEAFLSKRWFNQPNGSGLRVTLMLDLLNLMIEKARADGKQDELEKQILKAHWYITQFEENIRYHTPVDIVKNPDLAALPPARRSQRKQLDWPSDGCQLGQERQVRSSTRKSSGAGAVLADSSDEEDEFAGAGQKKGRGEKDEDFIADDNLRYESISEFEDESPKHREAKKITRSATKNNSSHQQNHHPPFTSDQQTRCIQQSRRFAGPTVAAQGDCDTDGVGTDTTSAGDQHAEEPAVVGGGADSRHGGHSRHDSPCEAGEGFKQDCAGEGTPDGDAQEAALMQTGGFCSPEEAAMMQTGGFCSPEEVGGQQGLGDLTCMNSSGQQGPEMFSMLRDPVGGARDLEDLLPTRHSDASICRD